MHQNQTLNCNHTKYIPYMFSSYLFQSKYICIKVKHYPLLFLYYDTCFGIRFGATSLCVWSMNHKGGSFDNVKLYAVIAQKMKYLFRKHC